MRTKLIAVLLAVLTALGGLNLFKSIKERFFPPASAQSTTIYESAAVAENGSSRVRVRVHATPASGVKERSRIRVREAAAQAMIDKRFDVKEGQNLRVDVQHADVTIRTENVSEAHVLVTLKSDDMSRAVEVFDRMKFEVEMDGDEVRVVSEPLNWMGSFSWNGDLDIHVDVTIPLRFNAQLTTTHGDVDLGDIEGRVQLNTTHGDVSVGTISGPEISLNSTHGDISGASLSSETVSITTTHADIEFDAVSSKTFTATTSHSDIQVNRLSGTSEIETSHGDIEVTMEAAFPTNLTTSHGNVFVYAPATAKVDLDLKAAQVSVSSDFAVDGHVTKDEVSGSLNGGGVMIRARTTHGSVNVKKQ